MDEDKKSSSDNTEFYNYIADLLSDLAKTAGLDTGIDIKTIFLEKWLTLEHKDMPILIIGGGYGREIQILLDMGFTNLFTVELSPKFAAKLRERFKENITVIETDFIELHQHISRMHQFAAILWLWCGLSDANEKQQSQAISYLSHWLMPDGRLIIDVPTHSTNATSVVGSVHYIAHLNGERVPIYRGYVPLSPEIRHYADDANTSVISTEFETTTKRKRRLWLFSPNMDLSTYFAPSTTHDLAALFNMGWTPASNFKYYASKPILIVSPNLREIAWFQAHGFTDITALTECNETATLLSKTATTSNVKVIHTSLSSLDSQLSRIYAAIYWLNCGACHLQPDDYLAILNLLFLHISAEHGLLVVDTPSTKPLLKTPIGSKSFTEITKLPDGRELTQHALWNPLRKEPPLTPVMRISIFNDMHGDYKRNKGRGESAADQQMQTKSQRQIFG